MHSSEDHKIFPGTDDWIKKYWYILEYYSAIKKKHESIQSAAAREDQSILSAAAGIYLDCIMLVKLVQKRMVSTLYGI